MPLAGFLRDVQEAVDEAKERRKAAEAEMARAKAKSRARRH